jgi:hypothetical protein
MKRLSLVLVVMGLGLFLFVPTAAAEEVTVDDFVEFLAKQCGYVGRNI